MAQQLKVFENFEALGLREDLLRGIYAYGFERPSAIQLLPQRDACGSARRARGEVNLTRKNCCLSLERSDAET